MDKDLNLERKKMRRQLKGSYKNEYKSIFKLLVQDMPENDKLQEIDLGILNLFVTAQQNGSSFQDIYGGSKEEFYLTLLKESGNFSLDEKGKLKRSERLINDWMVLILVAALIWLKISYTDFYLLRSEGFLYLQRNGAVIETSEVLKDEISFELNVKNLSENFNKTIYESENGNIVLESIIEENGNYIINFRTEGVLSSKGSTLVSAMKHLYDKNGASYFVMNASCSFELNEKNYKCSEAGMSGLDKKGDTFSFELFSVSDFIQGEFKEMNAFNNEEVVRVTLKGLIKTVWK